MSIRRAEFREDIQFQVLRRLYETPDISQRRLAKELGISLGSINFCFQALVKKGWVKVQSFSESRHKLRYAYLLTPSGISRKASLTARFLDMKMSEYSKLQKEIKRLKSELPLAYSSIELSLTRKGF